MRNVRVTTFFLLLMAAAFLGLAGRCFYLQKFKSEFYIDKSFVQQQSLSSLSPQRGTIYDRRGTVLAASNTVLVVKAEPRIIENPEEVSTRLSKVLDMEAEKIYELITKNKKSGYVRIKDDAEADECDRVMGRETESEEAEEPAKDKIIAKKKRKRIHHGIAVESGWRRHYPLGRLVANIVGFTSRDEKQGLEGIEFKYNKELSGSSASNVFLADAGRRPIRLKQRKGILIDGNGLILTIDTTIQEFARSALMERYKSYEAESALAVVADPKTGEILAMVSLPDYDPAEAHSVDPNDRRNRAITDEFEPGSIMKPIAMTIGLEAGAVSKNDTIFCENGSYSGRGFGRIGEYRNGFGNLLLRMILVKSSNIGMAKVGQKLGRKRLHEGLVQFGFGKRVGIELSGEANGFLRPVGEWTGYSETRIPFGQEITVTALQLVQAFCVIANGGRLVRPHLVLAMLDNEGNVIEVRRPVPPVGYIINPDVANWVKDAMVGVVNEGTGKRAKLERWQVFGKTGTANIPFKDRKGYSKDDYIASFVAGAPAEEPAVIVLVSIRKPNKTLGKGYTGGVVASPVAAKIIEKTMNYLERQGR